MPEPRAVIQDESFIQILFAGEAIANIVSAYFMYGYPDWVLSFVAHAPSATEAVASKHPAALSSAPTPLSIGLVMLLATLVLTLTVPLVLLSFGDAAQKYGIEGAASARRMTYVMLMCGELFLVFALWGFADKQYAVGFDARFCHIGMGVLGAIAASRLLLLYFASSWFGGLLSPADLVGKKTQ